MAFSETPKIQPIIPAFHLRILADEQLSQLKSATLEILRDVGIYCPSEKAIKIYAEHVAQVDLEKKIIKFPPEIVLEAMRHAPRFYTMGARSQDHDVRLAETYLFGSDSPTCRQRWFQRPSGSCP